MNHHLHHTLKAVSAQCFGKNQSLPSLCYTDTDLLTLEIDRVFRRGWLCLGRVDEIPEVGDYFTYQLLNEPLLVVRSDPDSVSVYANVCRHRAMPVAQGAGNAKRFVCPYHAWTYDLNGALKSAPLMKKKADLKHCGLPVIRSEQWGGFIFATFSNNVAPLQESLQGLEEVTANYQMASMHHIANFSEVWECNWKSLAENFMDGYHLSVVHPQSLRPLTPTNLCDSLSQGDAYTSYIANYAKAAPAREHFAPTLTEVETRQSRLFCVYPAMVASLSPDTLVYLSLQPVGVSQVQVKWGICVWEDNLSEEHKQQRIEKWQQINHEDHEVLQGLQKGLRSSFYQGGALAPESLEGCVSHFHDYLIRMLD